MKIGAYFLHAQNPYGSRQQPIHRAPQIVHWYRIFDRERGNLGQRMHPGVGPAGSLHANRTALDPRHNLFQHALYCGQARLQLPAVKIRAVVSDRNPNAS